MEPTLGVTGVSALDTLEDERDLLVREIALYVRAIRWHWQRSIVDGGSRTSYELLRRVAVAVSRVASLTLYQGRPPPAVHASEAQIRRY